VPSRARLVAGKVVAYGIAGLVLGLIAFALSAAIVSAILSARAIDSGAAGSEVAKIVVGGTLAATLYAILGVGLGALLRNQVGAIVGALGWIFVVESLIGIIPGLDEPVQKFGLSGLASSLTASDSGRNRLDQVPAGLLLAAYAAIFVVAGIAVLRRRDVTA
jgi:ABC-2 type transport system permease protein